MSVEINGILGLLLLIAIVYALIQIVQSSASTGRKVLWSVPVLVFPLIGVIIWFFIGPREGKA